jgi:hypothetical protein
MIETVLFNRAVIVSSMVLIGTLMWFSYIAWWVWTKPKRHMVDEKPWDLKV